LRPYGWVRGESPVGAHLCVRPGPPQRPGQADTQVRPYGGMGCYPPGAARDETPKPDARRGALHAPTLDVIDGKGIGKEKGACNAPLRMGAR
jgi:hypothetical protein